MSKKPDIFQPRKCVHLHIEREIYANFRYVLFQHGLSLQEVLNEFVKCAVAEDKGATNIITNLVKKKVKAQIEGIKTEIKDAKIAAVDHDVLYGMIDDHE